jgi:hypothetical protein
VQFYQGTARVDSHFASPRHFARETHQAAANRRGHGAKAICLRVCIFLICRSAALIRRYSRSLRLRARAATTAAAAAPPGILMSDLSTSVAHFISHAPDQEQVCCNDYWPLLHCRHLFSIQTEFTPKRAREEQKSPFHESSSS